MRGRVKITDIATELGVSPSTVSRALSNGGRISQQTRQAVLDLAEKWGYKPNPFAVNLLKKQSRNIGLILPEFTHHYFSKVLDGVNRVVNEHGYHLFINTHEGDYHKEVKAVNMLNNMRVDGIIASYARGTSDFNHFLDAIEDNVPVVFVDRMCEDLDTSYVVTDDFPGSVESVRHLVNTGCQKIVHIAGPENLSTSFNRLTGYKEGLKQEGVLVQDKYILKSEDPNWKESLEFLIAENDVDAITCFTDYLAFEAVEILKRYGKSVPNDVSVVGFADEPVATYMTPALTTVVQPAEAMGRRAAELLLWHIENPDSPEVHSECLPTAMIERGSTLQTRPQRSFDELISVLKSAS
ncbi:LacI family DNA-binding transcriptional regulator [Marinoscillum furvescens]|uniref:LacI family transcriptional regulator n=1 Tax=Marinoscillum furvescens DSM 4134 TaxID=1122208 RepID=A0A3D9KY32_MARFU|nr:LacI family DNA-binding transcriptional regulator [Marinoscillum furvescens]RED93020.1 LacI family transcriptional regulator [Marinoscillum furvescens DSM 4134]